MGGLVTGKERGYDKYPVISRDYIGWFETNGTSNPTKVSGSVESVTRLTSTGGAEFYRIRTDTTQEDNGSIVWADVTVFNDVDAGDQFRGIAPQQSGLYLSMPLASPAQLRAQEFDVAVINYSTNAYTNQVAPGRRVKVRIVFDSSRSND